MNMLPWLMPLPPLVLALLASTWPSGARSATVIGALLSFAFAVIGAASVLAGAAAPGVTHWIGLDALGALFALLTAFLGVTASLYSAPYIAHHLRNAPDASAGLRRYYIYFNLFLASLLAVPLMQQPALAWVTVELTTLFSIFLVGFDNSASALEAAWKYAVITIMGATVAALGFFLLLWGLDRTGGGPQTFAAVIGAAPSMEPLLRRLAFALILFGFGTKIGLVPVHTWLPDAHSQAPSPVCALLSGIEVSLILYVVMRLLPAFAHVPGLELARWLTVAGLLSVGVAAFLLLQVHDYKRLFAYSTVEHMGILLTALGLGRIGSYPVVLHATTHALTKSLAFYAAGCVLVATGTREIAAVRGLLRQKPWIAALLLIAVLAIAGSPPFAVFGSEIVILRAAAAGGNYPVLGLLALFIVIAFIGIAVQGNRMVFGAPSPAVAATGSSPRGLLWIGVLALAPVLLFGIWLPQPAVRLLHAAATELAGGMP
jgi:hydrogenase-4 component F